MNLPVQGAVANEVQKSSLPCQVPCKLPSCVFVTNTAFLCTCKSNAIARHAPWSMPARELLHGSWLVAQCASHILLSAVYGIATGRERCYRVQWDAPPQPESDVPTEAADAAEQPSAEAFFRKDANEVLVKDGADALRLCIDLAEPLPIRGLFRYCPGPRFNKR